jgi:hypothetical protein
VLNDIRFHCREVSMSHYLVVAHQTATSPELLDRAQRIAAEDGEADFTLLIPATHPTHLLHWSAESRFVWDEQRTYRIAQDRAREARSRFERAGLRVTRTAIGDASPVLAIEDELRLYPDRYDTIVLSTLPAGRSRWLLSGTGAQVAKFGLPVVHVGGEATPPRRSLFARIPVPPVLRELASGGDRSTMAVIGALMLCYLFGGVLLALNVNRGFFLNDAMALIVFSIILGGLAVATWRGSMR